MCVCDAALISMTCETVCYSGGADKKDSKLHKAKDWSAEPEPNKERLV